MPNFTFPASILTLALSLSLPRLPSQTQTLRQFTLDSCDATSDCLRNLPCLDLQTTDFLECTPPNTPDSQCLCLPLFPFFCSHSLQCPIGEVCATFPSFENDPICVSRRLAESDPTNFTILPAPPGGYSLDRCLPSTPPCRPPRQCFQQTPQTTDIPCHPPISTSTTPCVCRPPQALRSCATNSDCKHPENCTRLSPRHSPVCVSRTADPLPTPPPPAPTPAPSRTPLETPAPSGTPSETPAPSRTPSTTPAPSRTPSTTPAPSRTPSTTPAPSRTPSTSATPSASPSATPSITPCPTPSVTPTPASPICIDATALSHLPSHRLVFPHHARATVLCDRSGSCATPGHVVLYRGNPMCMRTYCNRVGGCVWDTRLVNSPRYQRRVRVASRTDGLVYTAFAARWETGVEEGVLAVAVRMGL